MNIKEALKKIWNYLKQDSWHSWLVSILLLYILVKLILFPLLGLVLGNSLPLVVIESCSMYHGSNFEDWWASHGTWYSEKGITKEEFLEYNFKNGLNKGDIMLVINRGEMTKGNILIFKPNPGSTAGSPTIHRIISESPFATKGDNNLQQLTKDNNLYKIDETSISEDRFIGKAVVRIPLLGWAKLIWFEPFRPVNERGFCEETKTFKITG